MNPRKITDEISVGPQLELSELPELARRGFRAVIVNRPDNEAPGQPPFAEIEAAAKAHGLQARYIPVVPGSMTEGDARAFAAALDELPAPVYAYCRSGARSASLCAMAEDLRRRGGAPSGRKSAAG